MFFDPMMTNINKHDCFQNHIIIIRPERRSFHKCGAQMGFLQLPAASPSPWRPSTDDETGLPPLNPLVLRTENRQNFIANFFFQKTISP
jgi:hypothetical protein